MKITMLPGISLDGFIALPNGDSHSWMNPEDDARYSEAVKKAGCILVGNKTYQQYKEDFDARETVMNFVCTTDETQKDTETTKFLRGSAEEILEEVRKYGFEELIVCGGGEINGMLASAGLVDEIIISIQEVTLGEGIPLFGSFKPELNLKLISMNQDVAGVVQIRYKVINS